MGQAWALRKPARGGGKSVAKSEKCAAASVIGNNRPPFINHRQRLRPSKPLFLLMPIRHRPEKRP